MTKQNVEISTEDIQRVYELISESKGPLEEAYRFGWAHALNSLHKIGYFSESSILPTPPYFRLKKETSTLK